MASWLMSVKWFNCLYCYYHLNSLASTISISALSLVNVFSHNQQLCWCKLCAHVMVNGVTPTYLFRSDLALIKHLEYCCNIHLLVRVSYMKNIALSFYICHNIPQILQTNWQRWYLYIASACVICAALY